MPDKPRRFSDAPFKRLPVELALSIVLLACGLFTFVHVFFHPIPPAAKTLEEKLVVLPTPPPPPPKPKPAPRRATRHVARLVHHVRPLRRPPMKIATNVATADKAVPSPAPGAETPPPSAPIGNADVLPGGNEMGAKAIFQPLPQIPDDLRQDALDVVALARFHVAADGTATVELVKATPNLELNALVLHSLQQWRFFPALLDGKPIASSVDIRIPIQVK